MLFFVGPLREEEPCGGARGWEPFRGFARPPRDWTVVSRREGNLEMTGVNGLERWALAKIQLWKIS